MRSCGYLSLKVELGKGLGDENGPTVKGLLADGYEAVFLGIGLPDPKVIPLFKGLSTENGFYTSKDFLPVVATASKPGRPVTALGQWCGRPFIDLCSGAGRSCVSGELVN